MPYFDVGSHYSICPTPKTYLGKGAKCPKTFEQDCSCLAHWKVFTQSCFFSRSTIWSGFHACVPWAWRWTREKANKMKWEVFRRNLKAQRDWCSLCPSNCQNSKSRYASEIRLSYSVYFEHLSSPYGLSRNLLEITWQVMKTSAKESRIVSKGNKSDNPTFNVIFSYLEPRVDVEILTVLTLLWFVSL